MSLSGNSSNQKSQSQSSSFYDPTQTGMVNNYAQGVVNAANDPSSALSYKPYTGPGLSFGDPTALQAMTGYTAPKVVGTGYTAANVDPGSVAGVTAGQIGTTDLSRYMNPYDQNVIDTTNADIRRSQGIAGTQADSQATAAGAFGGSRSAVLRNLSDDSYIRAQAATDANLRQAGFTQAQQTAGQDIATKLQADTTNQAKDLSVAQANQGAQNTALQFGAGAQNAASLANQQGDIAAATQRLQAIGLSSEQAQQLFGANWAQYVNSQQTPEQIQALQTQAMGLVPTSPLQQASGSGSGSSFGFSATAPK